MKILWVPVSGFRGLEVHLNSESGADSCCAQVYVHKDFGEGNKTECLCSKLPINLNFLLKWGFNVPGLVALLSHVRVASLLTW